MKAALEAWGASSNLFHQGFAKEVDDEEVIADTMEKQATTRVPFVLFVIDRTLHREIARRGSLRYTPDERLPLRGGWGRQPVIQSSRECAWKARQPPLLARVLLIRATTLSHCRFSVAG
jgi:hypothetical protein